MRSIAVMNTSLKFSLPLNIRCSNRWAKPVLPGFSFLEPTWYQVSMATTGVLWSSCTSTVRPLARTNFVYGIWGMGISIAAGRTGAVARAGALAAAGLDAACGCAMAGSKARLAAAASRRTGKRGIGRLRTGERREGCRGVAGLSIRGGGEHGGVGAPGVSSRPSASLSTTKRLEQVPQPVVVELM